MPDLGEDDEAIGTDSFESYDGKNRTADCIDGADEGHQSQHCSANYFSRPIHEELFLLYLSARGSFNPGARHHRPNPCEWGTGYVAVQPYCEHQRLRFEACSVHGILT